MSDDQDDLGDCPNEIIPPFDVFEDFVGPTDLHEAYRRARTPDSSLDPLRPFTTPEQLDDLHAYFVGVWDKHHGF
jgi:hypothetical protein